MLAHVAPSLAQVGLCWPQVGSKLAPNLSHVGPKLDPSWHQVSPCWLMLVHFGPRLAHVGPKLAQAGPQEAPSSFREAPCKLTESFPEGFQAVPGEALPWRVFLGWAQPWVGLSWLRLASGLSFPGLVLTFGKLSPSRSRVVGWNYSGYN